MRCTASTKLAPTRALQAEHGLRFDVEGHACARQHGLSGSSGRGGVGQGAHRADFRRLAPGADVRALACGPTRWRTLAMRRPCPPSTSRCCTCWPRSSAWWPAATLKLPPMLGYLAAGVLIGPHALALAQNSDGIRHLGEFGVVFLMFVIGLEFNLPKLRAMRQHVFGLGLAAGAADDGAGHRRRAVAGAAAAAGTGGSAGRPRWRCRARWR